MKGHTMWIIILGILSVAVPAYAQETIKVPLGTAKFAWTIPAPDPLHGDATHHVITCGSVTQIVMAPRAEYPVKSVVPGPGVYECTLYAENDFGRQEEPDVPFPSFAAGSVPRASEHLRLEVR